MADQKILDALDGMDALLDPSRSLLMIGAESATHKGCIADMATIREAIANPGPIDMVLFCPDCGKQHIDQPESELEYSERLHESSWWELGGDKPPKWENPAHKSHLCRKEHGGCGCVWRPSSTPTNGVKAVPAGKSDTIPSLRSKVLVDELAMRRLLEALTGEGHLIREIQFTRSLHKMGHPNPIDTLVEDFNKNIKAQGNGKG